MKTYRCLAAKEKKDLLATDAHRQMLDDKEFAWPQQGLGQTNPAVA